MNLKQNNLTLAKAFKKAFWINNENLVINNAFRDGKEWSLSVEESTMASAVDQSMVEGITLYDLCSKEDIKTVDLLKIDIEGAERVLFKDDDFLQATDKYIASIAVEIHDEFDIRPYINKKMETLGFSREEEGDISLYSKSMRSQVMPAEGSPF
jgi:FkbM family methyltransferase